LRRTNLDAAAFVAFQSVRATMLATLLERPPGLSEEELVTELVDLVLAYLVA
jgi:Tetracyclin repressor-like, C-terminal domain